MPTFDTTETKQDMHSASRERERMTNVGASLEKTEQEKEGDVMKLTRVSLRVLSVDQLHRPLIAALSLSLSAACLSQMDKSCSTSWPSASPRFQSTRVVQPPLFLTLCDTLLLSSRQDGKRNKLSFSLFWPGTYRDRLSIYEARY